MKGIIIASHGEMANGIIDTSKLFFGEQKQLKAFCIKDGEDNDEYMNKIAEGIKEVDSGDGVIVFCDMLFGTPCNCLVKLLAKGLNNVDVITGVNLPMILQVLSVRENNDVDIYELASQGTEGIKILKDVLQSADADEDED